MKIAIFDLDGTLADASHRISLIPDWDAFFNACHLDQPITPVIDICRTLYIGNFHVWIWSGRSDSVYEKTKQWLYDQSIPYHALRMRPSSDHRPDIELKREWFLDLDANTRSQITAVFEDRSRVVKMWRSLGLTCMQVSEGTY